VIVRVLIGGQLDNDDDCELSDEPFDDVDDGFEGEEDNEDEDEDEDPEEFDGQLETVTGVQLLWLDVRLEE
jgi:hypothetical protein